jgi:hypothetical protein
MGTAGGASVMKFAQNKKLIAIAGGCAAALIVLAVVLILALGGKSEKFVTASGVRFGGIWYNIAVDTTVSDDIYEFFKDGTFSNLYNGETMKGEYKVSGEKITCSVEGGEPFVLTPDKDGWLMGDGYEISLIADGKPYEDYMAAVGGSDPGDTGDVADSGEGKGDTFDDEGDAAGESDPSEEISEDGAPDGYLTFSDPDTGLQFYYDENAETLMSMDGDVTEIITLAYNAGYVFFIDVTGVYDEMLASSNQTEEWMARLWTRTFLESYSQSMFNSDWATATGEKDFTAGVEEGAVMHADPVEGRNFNTLSQLVAPLQFDFGEAGVYGAIHELRDADLKVFTCMIWDLSDDEQWEVLEGAIQTMRIGAAG